MSFLISFTWPCKQTVLKWRKCDKSIYGSAPRHPGVSVLGVHVLEVNSKAATNGLIFAPLLVTYCNAILKSSFGEFLNSWNCRANFQLRKVKNERRDAILYGGRGGSGLRPSSPRPQAQSSLIQLVKFNVRRWLLSYKLCET